MIQICSFVVFLALKEVTFSFQLAVVAIIFNIFRTIKVDNLLGKLLKNPDIYPDFEFLAFWQMQYNNMNAVNLFFAWIKVLTFFASLQFKFKNAFRI